MVESQWPSLGGVGREPTMRAGPGLGVGPPPFSPDDRSRRRGHSLGKGFSQVDHDRRLLPAAPQALVQRHGCGWAGRRGPAGLGSSAPRGRGRGGGDGGGLAWPRRAGPGLSRAVPHPRGIHTSQAARSVGLRRKKCAFRRWSGCGGRGDEGSPGDQAPRPPRGAGPPGVLPAGHALQGRRGWRLPLPVHGGVSDLHAVARKLKKAEREGKISKTVIRVVMSELCCVRWFAYNLCFSRNTGKRCFLTCANQNSEIQLRSRCPNSKARIGP